MNDENAEMRDRLRASELLARSEADFKDKLEHSVDDSLTALLARLDPTLGPPCERDKP